MNKKTKQPLVLVFAPSAYPLGGVQTWLDYLIPGLRNKGMDIRLVLTEGKYHSSNSYLSFHPSLKHIPILVLQSDNSSQVSRVASIKKLINKLNPDVCLTVNMVDVFQAVNELRACQFHELRLIATLHGVHAGMISMIQHYEPLIDSVVSTNRLTQALVNKRAQIVKQRSLYAPYGVPTQDNHAMPVKQGLKLAYVGRFEEQQKRVGDLLEILSAALLNIEGVEIHLAGNSDVTEVQNWVTNHKQYASQIYDHGILSPEDLTTQVYEKVNVLLLTSHWETGPIVAWEAMANNVTLVSSRYIGSQHEGSLIHEHNCLMFDVGDCHEALKQLKRTLNPSLRTQLNANAMNLVCNKYTVKQSISDWHQCIEETLSFEPRPSDTVDNIGADQGKLNTFFRAFMSGHGDWAANQFRKIIAKPSPLSNPGSEWPHSYRQGEDYLIDFNDL